MKIVLAIAFLALFVLGQALVQSDSEDDFGTLEDGSSGLYLPDTEGARPNKSTGTPYEYAVEKKTARMGETVRPRRTATPPQSNSETVATTKTKKEAGNGGAFDFAGSPGRLAILVGVGAAISCILAIYFVLSRRARREKSRPAVALMNLLDPPTSVRQHKAAGKDGRPRKAA